MKQPSEDSHAMSGQDLGLEMCDGLDGLAILNGASSSGILSRRVFHSPIVKWVFTARIREENKEDVIFIGENLIELKEWDTEKGVLRETVSKADFGSKIRSGAVLGDRVAAYERDTSTKGSDAAQSSPQSLPPQILILAFASFKLALLIAIEDENGSVSFQTHIRQLPGNKPLEQAGKHIATDPKSRAIAVCASERNLVLYGTVPASQRPNSALGEVIRDELILPVAMVILKMDFLSPPKEDEERVTLVVLGVKSGKTIARIYSWNSRAPLRPSSVQLSSHTLGRESGMPLSLIPLKSAGYFMIVGEHSQFLYLVSTPGSLEPMDSQNLEMNEPTNPQSSSGRGISCRKPLWVTWARPVRNSDWANEAVYLFREDGAVRYVQLRSKSPGRLGFDLSGHGGNLLCAIDTAFAILDVRQARNDLQNQSPDTHSIREPRNYRLGYPDVLVVPGSFSDGGLYEIGFVSTDGNPISLSRAELHKPQKRISFPNWAPSSDLCVVYAEKGGTARSSSVQMNSSSHADGTRRSPKLLTVFGKEPYGALSELRFGIEVPCKVPRRLLPHVTDQDPNFTLRYCDGILPVAFSATEMVMIFSYPWRTVFTVVDAETLTLDLVESNLGGFLASEEPTLAAARLVLESNGSTREGLDPSTIQKRFLVHVTRSQVQLLKLTRTCIEDSSTLSASLTKYWPIPTTLLAATQQNGPWLLIATPANQDEDSHQVSLKRFTLENLEHEMTTLGPSVDFDEEISRIDFLGIHCGPDHDMSGRPTTGTTNIMDYAAVGTTSGTVHLFAVDSENGLDRLLKHKMRQEPSDVPGFGAIESIAAIQLPRHLKEGFMLLCGTRDGLLLVLHVQLGDIPEITESRILTFGVVPLTVLPCKDKIGVAFVSCGSDICHIDFSKGRADKPTVTSVFYTDVLDPTFCHGSMDALCYLPNFPVTHRLSGCLMGVTNGEIVAGVADQHVKPLQLRRRIPGTPTKLLYSEHLNRLIVSSTVTQIHNGRRYATPKIALLDVGLSCIEDVMQEDIDDYEFRKSSFRFEAGERVSDMTEWFVTKNNDLFHFVVATTVVQLRDDQITGRIVILRSTSTENGKALIEYAEKDEGDPVFAICQNDQGSLIYCRGNDLVMRTYDPDPKRFDKRTLKSNMASPGNQITCSGPYIIVSTQLHSTLVFAFDENGQLTERGSDSRPRVGVFHLLSLGHSPNLLYMASLSNSVCSVVAWQGLGLSNAVEAILPCCITRLAKLPSRPRWKQEKPSTVIENDVVGVATDGSLFTFSVLDNSGTRLLYFIQSLCMRDARICPSLTKVGDQSCTERPLHPHGMDVNCSHIDGDILWRLMEMHNPRDVLREMLAQEVMEHGIDPASGIAVDCESVEERLDLFGKLVDGVVGQHADADAEGEARDAVDAAVDYMGDVLQLPF